MKSIFTKLSTLLLCGAVALAGCSDFSADLRDVNDRLDKFAEQTSADLADLRAEISELTASLSATYATKVELKTVTDGLADVNAALAELETLVDSKADASALTAAINDLQAKLDAIKQCECVPSEGCTCEPSEGCACDLTEIYAAIKDLQEKLDAIKQCTCEPSEGCTCEPTEECTCEPTDLSDINASIAAIKSDLTALTDDLTEYMTATDKTLEEIQTKLADMYTKDEVDALIKEQIDAVNEALQTAIAESEAAMEEAIAEAKAAVEAAFAEADKKISDELAALTERVAALEAKDVYTKEETDAAIAAAVAAYADVNTKIAALEEALAALTERVAALEDAVSELRSIVMVPQMIVNGVPSVAFESFVYVPMSEDSDVVPAIEGTYEILAKDTYAYYHFNPSTYKAELADCAVVSANAEIVTRSAAVPAVELVAVENGEAVKFTLKRAAGEGNMFALAVTVADAVVTSEYAQIVDDQTKASDLVFTAGAATLAEAQAGDPHATIYVGETYNVAEAVKVVDFDLASYGLEYAYTLVDSDLDINGGLVAATEASKGDNIVKVEVVDANANVVRRAYVKVRVPMEVLYMNATATASVEAERVAFEVTDIKAWAVSLYEEPNTIELIKQAFEAFQNYDYDTAYELLGGVPGFVKKTAVFTGEGTGRAKVQQETISGVLESVLDSEEFANISSIEDLKDFLASAAAKYPDSDLSEKLDEYAIIDYIPTQVLEIPFIGSGIQKYLGEYTISDLVGDGSSAAITAISIATDLLEQAGYDTTNLVDPIKSAVSSVIEAIESSIDTPVITEAAKAAAKALAVSYATTAASQDLIADIDAENEKIVAALTEGEGTWATMVTALDKAVSAAEFLKMTEVVDALTSIREYGLDLAQYTYPTDLTDYTFTYTVTEETVIE